MLLESVCGKEPEIEFVEKNIISVSSFIDYFIKVDFDNLNECRKLILCT
jgi:hypothetical protein